MLTRAVALLGMTCITISAVSAADKEPRTRLWNLTGETISKFELAPAGTTNWGPDQCKNDKDGSVDHDERLKIVGVDAGSYDARISFPKGRVCFARGFKIETGKVFSIEAEDLKDCDPK